MGSWVPHLDAVKRGTAMHGHARARGGESLTWMTMRSSSELKGSFFRVGQSWLNHLKAKDMILRARRAFYWVQGLRTMYDRKMGRT